MNIELFEKGFEFGCGVSLQQALSSTRFQMLQQANEELFQKYSEETDLGIALRAGHLNMGTLFNTVEESVALKKAQKKDESNVVGIQLRPMIQFLGEKLVEVAGECLPPEAIEMASLWKTADPESQLEMLHRLFLILRGSNQGSFGESVTMRSALTCVAEKTKDRSGIEAYLPKAYGRWDRDNCLAECQGKTQMVTAFARMAGAETIIACPVSDINNVVTKWRVKAQEMVKRDLFSRDLQIDAEFMESLTASPIYEAARMTDTNFHVGSAIRLSDGRWVQVDPHGMTYGLFPEEWGIGDIYLRLKKYQEVLPGLHLIGNDQGIGEGVLLEQFNLAEEIIRRSREMEVLIKERVKLFPDLVDLVARSEDLDLLLRLNVEGDGEQFEASFLQDQKNRETMAFLMLSQGEKNAFRLLSPEFLEFATHQWLTFYHALAGGVFLNQLQEAGRIIHPIAEFAFPEYNIAMTALNSLAIDFGHSRNGDPFFSEYFFCQMQLSNDLLFRRDLAEAAAKSLLALPHRHPLCERMLRTKGWK